MILVSLHEIKAKLSRYVARAAQGETVVITRRSRPMARLTAYDPALEAGPRRPWGLEKGKGKTGLRFLAARDEGTSIAMLTAGGATDLFA